MAREEPVLLCSPPDHGEQETGVQSRYQRPEGSQHHGEKQGPDLPLSTLLGHAGSHQFNSRKLVGNIEAERRSEGLAHFFLWSPRCLRESRSEARIRLSHQNLSAASFLSTSPQTTPFLSIPSWIDCYCTTLKHLYLILVLFRPCLLPRTFCSSLSFYMDLTILQKFFPNFPLPAFPLY